MVEFRNLKQQLLEKQRELIKLEATISKVQEQQLRSLPAQFGFSSIDELVYALAKYGSPALNERLESSGRVRRRAKIDEQMRQTVLTQLQQGSTAQAVATELKLSVSAVNQIKRKAGLTGKKTG